MIAYLLLMIGGILLPIFCRKNKFLFAIAVMFTTVGLMLVIATLMLVFAER